MFQWNVMPNGIALFPMNYVHHYMCRMQASKAVTRSGTVLGGSIMVGISACREPSVLDSLNTSSAPGLLDRYSSLLSVLLTILHCTAPERVSPAWAAVSPAPPAPSAPSHRPTRRPRPTTPWCPTPTRLSSPADSSVKPWSTCLVGRPVENPAGRTTVYQPTMHRTRPRLQLPWISVFLFATG